MEFCQIPQDEEGMHFGAYKNQTLICVASVYIDQTNARLRKFATYEEFQGKGAGTAVFKFIMSSLVEKGINYFWCDARESSLGFYERFGMLREGEKFYKAKIPYYKMSIILQ